MLTFLKIFFNNSALSWMYNFKIDDSNRRSILLAKIFSYVLLILFWGISWSFSLAITIFLIIEDLIEDWKSVIILVIMLPLMSFGVLSAYSFMSSWIKEVKQLYKLWHKQ